MTTETPSFRRQRLRRIGLLLGCVIAAQGVTSCGKKAEGQVVAVVDGEEVTLQQLNAELGQVEGRESEPDQQTRNLALNRVVDRALLAGIAREEGVEKSPEYILRQHLLEQNLLVQMMAEKLARDNQKPSQQEVDKLIRENPQAFGERTIFALDQLVFPRPARNDVLQALAATKSMEEVVGVLNKFGVKFQRGNNAVDSANLPLTVFRQMKAVGTSEPIVIPAGQMVTVAKVVEMRPAPVAGPQARAVATNAYAKQKVDKSLKAKLDAAKKTAKIDYQSGFSAPATPAAPGAAGSGAASPTQAAGGLPTTSN